MRTVFLAAVTLAANAMADNSGAGSFDRAYAEVRELSEICENAWLESTRIDALTKMEKNVSTMVLRMSPFDEGHGMRVEYATGLFKRCATLTYPENSFSWDD